MSVKKYKVLLSKDALADIKEMKKYILTTFRYREYAKNQPLVWAARNIFIAGGPVLSK